MQRCRILRNVSSTKSRFYTAKRLSHRVDELRQGAVIIYDTRVAEYVDLDEIRSSWPPAVPARNSAVYRRMMRRWNMFANSVIT